MFKVVVAAMLSTPLLPTIFSLLIRLVPLVGNRTEFLDQICDFVKQVHTYISSEWDSNVDDIANFCRTKQLLLPDSDSDSDPESEATPPSASANATAVRRSQRVRRPPAWTHDYDMSNN